MAVLLIVAVWAADMFLVRPAYDPGYFVVQRVVRRDKAHCRDMVIDRLKPDYYRVWTCGEFRYYHVVGDDALLMSSEKEQVPSCPRR